MPLTKTSYSMISSAPASVLDYGAIGDGVTDDTAAIQAAIDASKHVVVPIGMTCLISNTIIIPDSGHLLEFQGGYGQLGAYPGSYFIKKSTMTTPAITVGYSGTIIGGGVVCQSGNTGDGIQLVSGKGKLIQTYVTGAGRDGIRVGLDTSNGNCNSFYLENCVAQHSGRYGFYVHDNTFNVANANTGTLIQPNAYYNDSDGIRVGHGFWNTILNGLCEENGGYGLYLSGADNNSYPECRWTTVVGGDYNEGNVGGTIFDESYFSSFFGLDFNQIPATSTSTTQGSGLRIFIGSGATEIQNIQFPAIPRLTNNPNNLDTYEEGTFTPTVFGSTTTGTVTYNAIKGRYTRIGNTVSFAIIANWKDGTGTGNLQIGNLPFQSIDDSILFPSLSVSYGLLTIPANSTIGAIVLPNSNTIRILSNSLSGSTLNPLAYDASGELQLSGIYFV